jgi:5'-nucleotidase
VRISIQRRFRSRAIAVTAAAATMSVVALVPLSSNSPSANAVTIRGATRLSDEVSVRFAALGGPTTDFHVLGFNDFHGNLEVQAGGNGRIFGQYAGGAAYLAKKLKDLKTTYGNNVATVLAGDGIHASPLSSALFLEEPAILALNEMKVDFASVGNHEFDAGAAELVRLQNGGCAPAPTGCLLPPYPGGSATYPGATFQYLSANVKKADGTTLFPKFGIKTFTSNTGTTVKVGFIGEVLKSTPTIVTPSGVAGLDFIDEATAANAAATELKAQGVKAIVLVIHEGGAQSSAAAINGCNNFSGAITGIAQQLDPSIGVIVSGHTHNEYRCTITTGTTTRLVTSAASFGRIVSDITLTIDDATGEVAAASANNIVVVNSNPAAVPASNPPAIGPLDATLSDPTTAALVTKYTTAAAPLANQVIGKITSDISRTPNTLGESPLGDVIADTQLAATKPVGFGEAVVAFMNPGGIRADLTFAPSGTEAAGAVTYNEAYTVQPFGNSLTTMTLTGAQLKSSLEQQFVGCGGQTTQRILQVSKGFTYVQAATATACADKVSDIRINSVPISPTATYRVTVNSFLASGGDGFTVYNSGTSRLGGAVDIDALKDYLAANPTGVAPGPNNRILFPGGVQIGPERLLDTRNAIGAPKAKLAAGATLELTVNGAGAATSPSGAVATALNLTVTGTEGAGFLTVWPCGEPRPEASNLNFLAGRDAAAFALTKLPASGKVCIYSSETTHVLADVTGYEAPATPYVPVSPERLLDTRNGVGAAKAKPAADSVIELTVGGVGVAKVPATASAVNLSVTAVDPEAGGFLTVWPCGTTKPATSTLNFEPGQTVANTAIVKLGTATKVCLSANASAHLLADINGYQPATTTQKVVTPERLLDTRNAIGAPAGRVPAGGQIELAVIGSGATKVPAGATSAILNMTVTEPTGAGYLTVYPCGTTRPETSNVNFRNGQTVANLAIAAIVANGKVCIYSSQPAHVLADVSGWQ